MAKQPIIYKVENSKTWVELESLLDNLRPIRYGPFSDSIGARIADRIELIIMKDRCK